MLAKNLVEHVVQRSWFFLQKVWTNCKKVMLSTCHTNTSPTFLSNIWKIPHMNSSPFDKVNMWKNTFAIRFELLLHYYLNAAVAQRSLSIAAWRACGRQPHLRACERARWGIPQRDDFKKVQHWCMSTFANVNSRDCQHFQDSPWRTQHECSTCEKLKVRKHSTFKKKNSTPRPRTRIWSRKQKGKAAVGDRPIAQSSSSDDQASESEELSFPEE